MILMEFAGMGAEIGSARVPGIRGERADRPARVCFIIDRLRAAGTEMQLIALIRKLEEAGEIQIARGGAEDEFI